jgi:hypothetical protein
MFWLFLYLYLIGAFNDALFAHSSGADFKDWKTHVNVALWPLFVPAALIVSLVEAYRETKD